MTGVALEAVACAVCGSSVASPARVRSPRDDHALELGLPGGRSSWVVCDDCGLVYQSPRPDVQAVADLYTGGTYHDVRGGVPEHYVRYSLRRSRAALAWGLEAAGRLDEPGRVLDVGCGVGGALVGLRERGWDVVGVEPDPELAAFGRDRFGLRIVSGFFDDATFSDEEEFDLAFSCHVWEHLSDPRRTCTAVHRVLAPRRGYLLVVVPTFRRARTLAWACFTAPHNYMFTDVSLANLLDATGFDPVGHRYAAGGDSELWFLARARPGRTEASPVRREPVRAVQRELATVPFRAPLGIPGRLVVHARTMVADPRDFKTRLLRWGRARLMRARVAVGGQVGSSNHHVTSSHPVSRAKNPRSTSRSSGKSSQKRLP